MRFGPGDEECAVVVFKGNWVYVVSSSAEMDSESVSTAESRKVEVISNHGDKSRQGNERRRKQAISRDQALACFQWRQQQYTRMRETH